jgi:hypothetical protein
VVETRVRETRLGFVRVRYHPLDPLKPATTNALNRGPSILRKHFEFKVWACRALRLATSSRTSPAILALHESRSDPRATQVCATMSPMADWLPPISAWAVAIFVALLFLAAVPLTVRRARAERRLARAVWKALTGR